MRIFLYFCLFFLASFARADDWTLATKIVEDIELPRIPNHRASIVDCGARSGSKFDALPAIQKCIDDVSAQGGGTIHVPAGTWYLQGPLKLKSRINLNLDKEATLLFSEKPEYYLPVVHTRWEGTEVYTYSPLIYAANVEDVSITGGGKIDGNAKSHFHGWHKKQTDDIRKLRRMGFDGIPLEARKFGKGTYLRPPLIQFFHAKRILLEDYICLNSPFWVNHLVYTDHATVRGIRVDSHFPNNDGIDIDSSSHVLVESSWFRTGDDSVVVKSGRDLDGRTIGVPSQNIVVRNNDMGGEDGIALGSEMSGGIRNVFFDNNILRKGLSAIRFKSNLDRGGRVEHIRVRNFEVEAFDNLFWFQLNYPSELGGHFPATYRYCVRELQCSKSRNGIGSPCSAKCSAGISVI